MFPLHLTYTQKSRKQFLRIAWMRAWNLVTVSLHLPDRVWVVSALYSLLAPGEPLRNKHTYVIAVTRDSSEMYYKQL